NDREATPLEATHDLADEAALDRVRLAEDQRAITHWRPTLVRRRQSGSLTVHERVPGGADRVQRAGDDDLGVLGGDGASAGHGVLDGVERLDASGVDPDVGAGGRDGRRIERTRARRPAAQQTCGAL